MFFGSKGFRIALLAITSIVVGLITWGWNSGRSEFECLVNGDQNVSIKMASFSGQGKQFILSDEKSLRSLAQLFRASHYEGYLPQHPGLRKTYEMNLVFGSGNSVPLGIYVSDNEKLLTVMYGVDNFIADPTYYQLNVGDDLPDDLANMFCELRK
jgi:hypothetical protein